MRTGWRLTATIVAGWAVTSCGSSGDPATLESGTARPTVATTVTQTTGPPATTATTAAPTTAATTTVGPTTTALSGPGAPDQLAAFLSAYDLASDRLGPLMDQVQTEIDESGTPSDDVYQAGNDAAGDVFDLTRLVPAGLAPSVFRAVHDAVMMMAASTAAFIYAPGWEASEWPEWRAGMMAAQAQLLGMRALVVSAASAEPAMAAVAPGSRAAAEVAVLPLEVGRRFGHGGPGAELDASVPVIHWIGALPSEALDGTPCYFDGVAGTFQAPTGDFVEGIGGCAVVFYDGIDHADEVAAWMAAPSDQLPSGEFVAFVLTAGTWRALGSVE